MELIFFFPRNTLAAVAWALAIQLADHEATCNITYKAL